MAEMQEQDVILLTGSEGYIGTHLKPMLKGDFINYDSKIGCDLEDTDQLDQVFRDYNITSIIHLAASIDLRESYKDPAKYYENNIVNTIHLLKYQKPIVFTSSAAVYGDSPYGKSKMMAERVIQDCVPNICLRLFNVAGGAQKREGSLIKNLARAITDPKYTLDIYDNNYREYVHVEDICRAIVLAHERMDSCIGSIDIGTGFLYSTEDVVTIAARMYENFRTLRLGHNSAKPAISSDGGRLFLDWNHSYGILDIIKSAVDYERSKRDST